MGQSDPRSPTNPSRRLGALFGHAAIVHIKIVLLVYLQDKDHANVIHTVNLRPFSLPGLENCLQFDLTMCQDLVSPQIAC